MKLPLVALRRQILDAGIRLSNPALAHQLSIPSHITLRERVKLTKLALAAEVIVEIGSFVGASACCFAAALQQRGRGRIFCIDTWNNDAMTEGVRDTWAEFQKNTARFSEHIVAIRGYSHEVVEKVRSHLEYCDLLFIDGDHSYEAAKSDWECYRSLLRSGSIVVFHDIGWAEGVQRVVEEDVAGWVTESGSLPNLWWGTVARCPA